MNIEVLYFVFLINYVYLVMILVRQGWRDYRNYIFLLSLATLLSIAALYYQVQSLLLVIFSSVLFVALAIAPIILSRHISINLSRAKTDGIVRYARWRYFLTLCRAYRVEYLLFQCWQLISTRQFQKAVIRAESLFAKIPEQYWLLLYQMQACAYNRLDNWEKTVEIYRDHLVLYPTPLVLANVVEAYCYNSDIYQAISTLIQLESQPEKKYLPKQLATARLAIHAHAGNCRKVEQLLPLAGLEKEAAYWLATAHAYAGSTQQALTYLNQVRVEGGYVTERKLRLLESRLAQEPLGHNLKLGDLYKSLEIWEKGIDTTPEAVEKTPWVTWALIGVNLLFFLFMEWRGSSDTLALFLLNLGANSFEFVIYQHEYWRLVSSMFLHFGYLHLFFNLYALHFFGSFVERFYGRRAMLILYVFCGILASLISIAWRTSSPPLSLGASGAICGLMGVNTYFFIFRGRALAEHVRRHYVFSFLFMIISMALLGHFVPHIDNAAHFGGIFCGLVLGALFKSKDRSQSSQHSLSTIARQLAMVLAIAALLLSFWQQVTNYFFCPYPQQPTRLAWYTISHNKAQIKIALPFTWKIKEKMTSHVFSNDTRWRLPEKSAPVSLPDSKNLFWDYYNVSEEGMLTVSFATNFFSVPPIYSFFATDEIIKKMQKIGKESRKFSVPQQQKIGTHSFWLSHYQFSAAINHSKKDMIVLYYYLRIGHEIYRFGFRLPPDQLAGYRGMIEQVLGTVSIQSE